MKKLLKITIILALALIICSMTVVNATTSNKLLSYASKTFTVAGEKVALSSADKLKVERFLKENPVSDEDADKIIAKVEKIIAIMDAEGVSDYTKLSKEKKNEIYALAQEAAAIAGVTLSYDASTKTILIYKDGKLIESVSMEAYKLVQTGSNSTMYIVLAVVAVIAIATVLGYRKIKSNA